MEGKMGNPDDDLLMREINSVADKASEIAPKTLDISLYAATFAKHFDREEDDIKEQIRVVLRARGLFWNGD
jgi:hypothetical protein